MAQRVKFQKSNEILVASRDMKAKDLCCSTFCSSVSQNYKET